MNKVKDKHFLVVWFDAVSIRMKALHSCKKQKLPQLMGGVAFQITGHSNSVQKQL